MDRSLIDKLQQLAPGFHAVSDGIHQAEQRSLRLTPLAVTDYKPTDPKSTNQLAAPGTITVAIGRRGSKLLRELRTTAGAGRGKDQKLAQKIAEDFRKRKPITLAEATAIRASQKVVADLRFGGTVLARNLFVPDDREVAILSFPYNGGAFPKGGFTLAERVADGAGRNDGLEAVILRYAPLLSRAEAAAIRKVPADQRELNVGSLGDAANALEIVLMVLLYMMLMRPGDLSEQHILDDRIRELGPLATARQLVALRRDSLLGNIAQGQIGIR
ncbi:MAG TPA: hypothetical protein VN181_14435 [Thermoanaerobaculia bacterium]|nr:hypothetical protein [Thermoanaerobaculia bacterium]